MLKIKGTLETAKKAQINNPLIKDENLKVV